MKIALCLQHVPFEGPGIFRRSLETRGYLLQCRLVPVEGIPQDLPDFLLIMGGPMSVNDADPWIETELQFVQAVLEKEIPILGICLGAQLLAKASGASVAPGPRFEIGMESVSLTEGGKQDAIFRSLPSTFPVFQWHGEGMTLPPGAMHLAASPDFPIQAFRMKDYVYGLLFHPEMEETGIRALCRECPQDVQRGGVLPEKIQDQARCHLPMLHQLADRVIDAMTRWP